jgi:hypothetical protein
MLLITTEDIICQNGDDAKYFPSLLRQSDAGYGRVVLA